MAALKTSSNNFDGVAWCYDWLASCIFGNAIKKAQISHLHNIEGQKSVLILGGGTGYILETLLEINPGLEITYLEKSKRMITKSMDRVHPERQNKLVFANEELEEWKSDQTYDIVICPFFLDVFNEENLTSNIIPKIRNLLKPGGNLLVSDFQHSEKRFWHQPLMTFMHLFFRITCRLESQQLSDIRHHLNAAGFNEKTKMIFFSGMIFSSSYSV